MKPKCALEGKLQRKFFKGDAFPVGTENPSGESMGGGDLVVPALNRDLASGSVLIGIDPAEIEWHFPPGFSVVKGVVPASIFTYRVDACGMIEINGVVRETGGEAEVKVLIGGFYHGHFHRFEASAVEHQGAEWTGLRAEPVKEGEQCRKREKFFQCRPIIL